MTHSKPIPYMITSAGQAAYAQSAARKRADRAAARPERRRLARAHRALARADKMYTFLSERQTP